MGVIKTTDRRRIDIDAAEPVMLDLLEAMRETITARHAEYETEDAVREIEHLVDQMTPDEARAFLREFMHFAWLRFNEDQIARDYEARIRQLNTSQTGEQD